MKLKESQIEFIEGDLAKKGITNDQLHEDLVDHICCEVEANMADGVVFMDAYVKAIDPFEKRGVGKINLEFLSILNTISLIKNFFITSSRFFVKNLGYSLIRVFGLAIGFTAFVLSLLYMKYEYSYDSFHENSESTYRLARVIDRGTITTTAFPLVPALRNDFPQYTFSRYFKDRSSVLFRRNEASYFEEGMIFADKDFLNIFDFPGFLGSSENALAEPFSVVITRSIADKYFGDQPALGEFIEFSWNDKDYPLRVAGIIPSWPENMHIKFDILVSFATTETVFPNNITTSWNMNYCYSYVQFPSAVDPLNFKNEFQNFIEKHVKDDKKNHQEYLGNLQPLSKIHLQPEVLASYTNTINPTYPQIAIAIGFLVLLITSINFITLTLAQFQDRAREVGIRKAIGANRRQVILQLVLETLCLVTISFLISGVLTYLLFDKVNSFMLTDLSFAILYSRELIFLVPLIIIVITLITGLYPAIFFSSHNIMGTINFKGKSWKKFIQHGLLTVQFMIASVLIILSLVIYKQIDFIENKELGYNKDQVIYVSKGRSIRDNSTPFKTLVKSNPSVQDVSLSFYKPTDDVGNTIEYTLYGESFQIATTSVDEDFFKTFEIDFIEGENFPTEEVDMTKMIIINESAAKLLGGENLLGESLKFEFSTGQPSMPVEERESRIIGVVEDVHFESLHNPIKPIVFLVKPYWYFYINIRLNGQDLNAAIDHVEQTWKSMFNNEPFEYVFLDQEFERLYQKEQKASTGLIAMSFLAILTSCLGLFGYVKYLFQQKIKEVGIRKVLGAGTMNIAKLLSKEYLIVILISNVISWPIGYYIGTVWLENFSYHTAMTIIPFIMTSILLLGLSFVTISREIFVVMSVEPSATLRYD